MPVITPDFSEAATGAIPAGTYKARIVDAEVKTSKAGNAYIQWKMQIFGAEGQVSRYNNWNFNHRTMTSGKGAGMLKDFYKAATGEIAPTSFDTDILLGKEVQVVLAEGKDQDGNVSSYPEVKGVRRIQ